MTCKATLTPNWSELYVSPNNLPNSLAATIASLAPSDVVHKRRDPKPNDLRRLNKASPHRFPTPSPGNTCKTSNSMDIGLATSDTFTQIFEG